MRVPYAAIRAAVASSGNTQATTSTAATLTVWSASNTAANVLGSAKDSDYSVRADKANNRVIVMATGPGGQGTTAPTAPGRYKLKLLLQGTSSGDAVVTARFRKNGTYISGTCRGINRFDSGIARQIVVEQVVEITAADLNATNSVAAFDDPPTGGVIGAAFAPRIGVPIDVDVASSASVTMTWTDAELSIERID